MAYTTFKESGCSEYPYYDKYGENSELTEEQCQANYVAYERSYGSQQRGRRIFLVISITQVIIVSGTLFLINRKK